MKVGMQRDGATTEEIWQQLGAKIKSFISKRVSDKEAVEDLVQETFIRIHEKLDSLNESNRTTAWVFQIARNLVIDYYRAKANSSALTGDEIEEELVEDENINELVAGWLPMMIAKLPDPYREAIELYELRGMPQQQIADELQISLSGAKSRIQRGRLKLKEQLFDCCSFEKDRRGNVIAYREKTCDATCDDNKC